MHCFLSWVYNRTVKAINQAVSRTAIPSVVFFPPFHGAFIRCSLVDSWFVCGGMCIRVY